MNDTRDVVERLREIHSLNGIAIMRGRGELLEPKVEYGQTFFDAMAEIQRLREAEREKMNDVLRRIDEKIRLFNLICSREEYTDTDEVWTLLGEISEMCNPMAPKLADMPLLSEAEYDELVLDLKCREGSNINNEGIRSQLEYISEAMPQKDWALFMGWESTGLPK